QAYIADRTTPENRTARLAGFSAAFGLGGMIGPAFAGALASVSEVAPLFGVAILSFCSILIISAKVTERSAPKERKAIARLSPTDRRIRLYLIFGFASATVTAIPIQFASFYVIDRIGISPADALGAAGIALSTGAGASLFAQIALVQRFNLKPFLLLRAGPALLLAGHLAIALSQDIGALTFGMMLGGLGAGLVTPGYVGAASLAVSVDEQGAVAGLSNAAAASSYIVAPPLGYLIYAINPVFLFIATAGIAASTLVLALCSPRLGKPPQATG
ncbi:MAG: MFS transporter, partial [Pseudomonadota bacterium]